MKIFYLGYSLNKNAGGIEKYTHTILKYLKNKGHKIIVYTIEENNYDFENVVIDKNFFLINFLFSYFNLIKKSV